jgi:hypothetical protein
VAEPEPRYVATFRPETLEMVTVAFLVLLGAVFVVGFAQVARGICEDSDCSSEGRVLLIVAVVGFVRALAMLVESGRTRGHPWPWFFATVLVYAIWAVAFEGWVR